MNASDTIDLVANALKKNGITIAIIHQVVADINKAAAEEAAAKEPKAPKAKTQVVILVREPQAGDGAKPGEQFGWAIKTEAGADPLVIRDRIIAAAASHNRAPKRKGKAVATIGEALQYVKGRHWKDEAHPERVTAPLTRDITQLVTVAPNLG